MVAEMISEDIKELEAARAKVAELEKTVAAQLTQELVSLPGKYGYADLNAFISALKKAAGVTGKSGKGARAAAKAPGTGERRKRAVITDETRAEVKRLVEAGSTGSQIATTLGISLPSVQNIKKALGLVRA